MNLKHYLDKPFQDDLLMQCSVTNISDKDFTFDFETGETDPMGDKIPAMEFTIPSGSTMTFPINIALHATIKLAKKISIDSYPTEKEAHEKGALRKTKYLPIAEKIFSDNKEDNKTQKELTETDKLRESIQDMNNEEKKVLEDRLVEANKNEKEELEKMSYQEVKEIAEKKDLKLFQKSKAKLIEELTND